MDGALVLSLVMLGITPGFAHAETYTVISSTDMHYGPITRTETVIQVGSNPLNRFTMHRVRKNSPAHAMKGSMLLLPPLGPASFNFYEFTLERTYPDGDLCGLAQRAQIQIGKVGAGPWQMATDEDRRWPATEGAEPLPLAARLLQQYAGRVLRTMLTDVTVAEAFTRVQQMIAPPTLFFRPDIVARVLVDYLRRWPLLTSTVATRATADGRAVD